MERVNEHVAAVLKAHGEALTERGAARYRSQAYHRAAQAVEGWDEPVDRMEDVRTIPGVGTSIAHAIGEILAGTWEGPLPERQATTPEAAGLVAAVRGDLHAHTVATDGRNTIVEMAEAARARGYEYIAITDHSQETRIAGGLDPDKMRVHLARVRRVDEQTEGIRVLTGAEVDILKDGRLDLPDDLLADMDVVVCSVHFRHNLSGREQTQRILRGMSNDHADILAHPTTRRKGIRPGLALGLEEIAEAAGSQGWAIELNGSPERRDLCADDARLVTEVPSVMVSVDSDAHSTAELDNMRFACMEAAAAQIPAERILNTLPLKEFQKRLRS